MARFTVAYTREVKCHLIMSEHASRSSLKSLVQHGYIEYHANDGDINAHLITETRRPGKKSPRAISHTETIIRTGGYVIQAFPQHYVFGEFQPAGHSVIAGSEINFSTAYTEGDRVSGLNG